MGKRLSDVGERWLIESMLAKRYGGIGTGFGDDVVPVFSFGETTVVATTDPAPLPLAWSVGVPVDYYDLGWLLATINLSDLAAAGAEPLGLLTSLTLPASTQVDEFRRLLDGVDDCCTIANARVLGGNLKDSNNIVCEATAFGVVDGPPMSRLTASSGQTLVGFGEIGAFSAALFALRRLRKRLDAETAAQCAEVLCRPKAQVDLGLALRHSGFVRASSDASDGVFGAVRSLAVAAGASAIMRLDRLQPSSVAIRVAKLAGVDPVRFALGIGDFALVCSVEAEQVAAVRSIAEGIGVASTVLGEMVDGSGMSVEYCGRIGPMANFDNERFTETSQFISGAEAYEDRLIHRSIFASSPDGA